MIYAGKPSNKAGQRKPFIPIITDGMKGFFLLSPEKGFRVIMQDLLLLQFCQLRILCNGIDHALISEFTYIGRQVRTEKQAIAADDLQRTMDKST